MLAAKSLTATLSLLLLSPFGLCQDSAAPTCFYTGATAKPGVTIDYEGTTYAFSSDEKKAQFEHERTASLYHQIGGAAALTAAVDLFYVKVLADKRVNHFFV